MSNLRPTPRKPGAVFRRRVVVPPLSYVMDAVNEGLQRAREALTAEGWALGHGPVHIGTESYTKR